MTDRIAYLPVNVTRLDMQKMREGVKKDNIGYVYFVVVDEGEAVKIGFATDLLSRVQGLQTGNHQKLSEYFCIRAPAHAERIFQRMFEHEKIRLEWFNHSDEVEQLIDCLQDVELANLMPDDEEDFFFTPDHIAVAILDWENSFGRGTSRRAQ